MSKALALLAVAPLSACTTDTPPTPLAQIHGGWVDMWTTNEAKLIQPQLAGVTRLSLSGPDGSCIRFGDDVTADLDGVRMQVDERGGPWDSFGEAGCNNASFELATPTIPHGTSTLLVRDSATTWTITGADLFANDFTVVDAPVAGQQARVVWQSADSIDNGAYAQFQQGSAVMFANQEVTEQANTIDVALPAGITGAGTLSVNASRTVRATRCEGPATCTLQVNAGADLPLTIEATARSPLPARGPVAATL